MIETPRKFGPNSCKPMLRDPCYVHHLGPVEDDGKEIVFNWVFPAGTLAPRMSGYELALFIADHMDLVLPLMADSPRIQKEFRIMRDCLVGLTDGITDMVVTDCVPSLIGDCWGYKQAKCKIEEMGNISWLRGEGPVGVSRARKLTKDGFLLPYGNLIRKYGFYDCNVASFEANRDTQAWQNHKKRIIKATDCLLPWIKSVAREKGQDVIVMDLNNKASQPVGPTYFL